MKDVLNTKQLKEKKEQNVAKKVYFRTQNKNNLLGKEKCMNCDEFL